MAVLRLASYAKCGLTLPPTGVEEAERVNANSAADSFLFEGDEDCRPYARMNVDEEPRTIPEELSMCRV